MLIEKQELYFKIFITLIVQNSEFIKTLSYISYYLFFKVKPKKGFFLDF